ncbi:U-box domain-containing protein 16-like [Coffea arabica]|uniref:RING-type E3 ubiquitin transferase n=1 Tax=Coffea arabica TaxID=13443 RepID=A0A6P6SYG7_COFAR|nr:U-box domain-containing protein 16-like [Coffea arabica]
MAVSPDVFPPRKRRQPAPPPSFCSSDKKLLLQSLLLVSQEICSLRPLGSLLKRNTSSIIRKSRLLSIVFEELLRLTVFPPAALVCLEELYILLTRIKALVEDSTSTINDDDDDDDDHHHHDNNIPASSSSSSKMWLLLQHESISNSFHDLNLDLFTILDIFPAQELDLCQDVRELLALLTKHCFAENERAYPADSPDALLRIQLLDMLDSIHREIIPDPSHLAHIFRSLGLADSTSCRDEIESLQRQHHLLQLQADRAKSAADITALIGLVRYAKCVLYGASATPGRSPRATPPSHDDLNIPPDFRCPISLDLMRDPVVVSTGQTYDRTSIVAWIESGHNTCPKTGQSLAHADVIPNRALQNLIAAWCREQRIPFLPTGANPNESSSSSSCGGAPAALNKTALEATKMTVTFLLSELTASQEAEMANRVVHELRVLAKADSDSRACIAEAGALPLLLKFLGSEQSSLQVNAVTTILNLSILEANKTRIMETEGVLNGVIEVLRSGATWEAKGNAAATIFSLTGVHAYRKRLGRKARVVKALVDLARDGPGGCKRDAMVAILNLAWDREAVGKLIEARVVDMVREVMGELPEEAVTVLEAVVRRGGLTAVAAAYHVVEQLAGVLREGSDTARESAAATLANMCRKGGSEMVGALAAVAGVERVIWEVMGMGTGRGRRKAATLLRILRRWAAGLDEADETSSTSYSAVNISPSSSTRGIVLPG